MHYLIGAQSIPFRIWAGQSDMLTPRHDHICALVIKGFDEKEVVAAGGQSGNTILDSVEVFSMNERKWRAGSKTKTTVDNLTSSKESSFKATCSL